MKWKFGNKWGLHFVFIYVLLTASYATINLGYAFASDQSLAPTDLAQGEQDSNGGIDTFQTDGAIGSLIIDDAGNSTLSENVVNVLPVYVLAGNWSMGVVNQQANYLQVDFVMGFGNGTDMHEYSIENLRNIVVPSPQQNPGAIPEEGGSTGLVLSPTNNYSLSIFGYVDVARDDTLEWQNVPMSMNIFNGNTVSILLYPSDTDNFFKGQPIYGIVTYILDANDQPIKELT